MCMKKTMPLKERLKKNMRVDENGCWRSTVKSKVKGGYTRIHVGSRTDGSRRHVLMHRASYEAFVGPIPEGMTIDHLCEVTDCINPEHLKPATLWDNGRRSKTSPTAVNARKTECPKCGGQYSVKPTGGRDCRPCRLDYFRQYNAKRSKRVPKN